MTFDLPYPPTTNHAYLVRGNRKVKTDKARDYAYRVGIEVAKTIKDAPGDFENLTGKRLAVHIRVNAPDKRRRDLSNTEKLATDAVMHALGLDDSQIDLLTLERGPVNRPHGSLAYTITPDESSPF
jgi:Holliday junction resolvase RusA-like endonuclease